MKFFAKSLLIGAMLVGFVAPSMLPASAAPSQGTSNRNIWHVRHHLEYDIDQLQHDQRDYHGYRDRAIVQLQDARNQLLAAEEFARRQHAHGFTGVDAGAPGVRNQWQSNMNLWKIRGDIERQIRHLAHDDSDYGGHKRAAILALQRARREIVLGERYARAKGY